MILLALLLFLKKSNKLLLKFSEKNKEEFFYILIALLLFLKESNKLFL